MHYMAFQSYSFGGLMQNEFLGVKLQHLRVICDVLGFKLGPAGVRLIK